MPNSTDSTKVSDERKRVEARLHGTPHGHVNWLRERGIPYTLKYTSSTAILITEHEKLVFADERVLNKEYALRAKIKKDIRTNVEGLNLEKNPYQPRYYKWSPYFAEMRIGEGEVVRAQDVWEIDLTKAYYYAANQLGYLSDEFFDKTMKVPKRIRLRLLGSIATIRNVEEFDGKELVHSQTSDALMRLVWHNIVCHVDEVMVEIADALHDHFLFYWVDGIYFTTFGKTDMCSSIVEGIAYGHGFEVHKKRLDSIEVRNENGYLHAVIRTGKDHKIFAVPNRLNQY